MTDGFTSPVKETAITEEDHLKVSALLGRSPRGLRAIAVCSTEGEPVVIQVASLVDGKPFPTLFWLVDKKLNYAIDQVEATGLIAQLQARIDASEELQASLANDHKAHIALRQQLTPDEQAQQIQALGFAEALATRGIGGIANFTRIRCLHTYYASHLVVPNSVGKMLDDYWQEHDIHFDHLN